MTAFSNFTLNPLFLHSPSPQFLLTSSPTSSLDRLNLPSVLVLNRCGISRAGDQAEIAAFCAHVMELDLSHNKLQDWHEVLFLGLLQLWIPGLVIFSIFLLSTSPMYVFGTNVEHFRHRSGQCIAKQNFEQS